MLFEEALKHLISGEYVARSSWDAVGEYIIILPSMPYIWKILTQPNPNAGNWMPTIADLLADDYKVIENCAHNPPQV